MAAKRTNSETQPESAEEGANAEQDDPRRQLELLRRRLEAICGISPGICFEVQCSDDASKVRVDFLGPGAETFLGLAPQSIIDRPLLVWDLVHADDRASLVAAFGGGAPAGRVEFELRLTMSREDGTKQTRWIRLVAAPIVAKPNAFRGFAEDITSRKAEEESIRASERQFRQLAENIKEMFWVSEVSPRKILYVSPVYRDLWGRSCESLYQDANSFLEGIHPEDRQRVEDSLPAVRLGGYDQTYRVVHRDGSIRTLRARAFPVRDENGVVYRIAGICEDITQSRQAEVELLAERRFLEHLLQMLEGERRLVAYDIHDGFLQSVIAAVMHLEALDVDSRVLDTTHERLAVPLNLLRDAIEEARRMISGLRPPIIDEQGLVAAIEYLINEAPEQSARITFDRSADFPRLDGVLEGALFRIVQEALSNVRRHSQAETAHVSLIRTGERVRLTVDDSGVGFDPQQTASRQFGLRGIAERARLFGGTAEIRSAPGRGTHISVDLPLTSALGDNGSA